MMQYDIKSIGDNQIEMTEVHEKFGAVDCKATFCDKGSEWVSQMQLNKKLSESQKIYFHWVKGLPQQGT